MKVYIGRYICNAILISFPERVLSKTNESDKIPSRSIAQSADIIIFYSYSGGKIVWKIDDDGFVLTNLYCKLSDRIYRDPFTCRNTFGNYNFELL